MNTYKQGTNLNFNGGKQCFHANNKNCYDYCNQTKAQETCDENKQESSNDTQNFQHKKNNNESFIHTNVTDIANTMTNIAVSPQIHTLLNSSVQSLENTLQSTLQNTLQTSIPNLDNLDEYIKSLTNSIKSLMYQRDILNSLIFAKDVELKSIYSMNMKNGFYPSRVQSMHPDMPKMPLMGIPPMGMPSTGMPPTSMPPTNNPLQISPGISGIPQSMQLENVLEKQEKEDQEIQENQETQETPNSLEYNKKINLPKEDEFKDKFYNEFNNVHVQTPKLSYSQTLMKDINTFKNPMKNSDFLPLFQRHCLQCGYSDKLSYCTNTNKSHKGDTNFEFSTLPFKTRCLRKVCMDLACNRKHHELTQRIPVQCKIKNCNCPHYVHKDDTFENKPFFWKPYEKCIPKPSKEIINSYFLLYKK